MKACPFCGSRARVQAYRTAPAWARAMCTNKECAARGPTVKHFVSGTYLGRATDITFDELKTWAERAWNGRAE